MRVPSFVAMAMAAMAVFFAPNASAIEGDSAVPTPTCSETIPPGATRPTLAEKVVARSKTATLPADLPSTLSQGEVRLADDGSFGHGALPETSVDKGDPAHATTLLRIPFVVLSTSVHRKHFTLPAVKIIVLRRGGGDMSLCSASHEIDIDQPIASTPDPLVRPNPPSVPQITRNEQLQAIVTWSIVALLTGAALAAAFLWWRSRRPKYVPPPPPPTPPWVTALAQIESARTEYLAEKIETKVYYDRLSDAVRAYLGRLHGFDGLDLTTDEIVARMRKVPSPLVPMGDIVDFLGTCDLVKFAGQRPGAEEGADIARQAEALVRSTSPMGGYYLTATERGASAPPRPRGFV